RITREHPGETVVVVGHGGTIGSSFVSLGDQPIRAGNGPTHEVTNTSITQWRWNARGWRLVRFNDAAHLYDL
ncbi:MAG: 2,3-bisphosphoglycerate-dependent phosphoglycerate mutase, partial [Actinomycetota bacterium]|nr:2,3-bisphosphoglycerate-dependent phosphoglycerate mutase [Actinomycetota bacterium]